MTHPADFMGLVLCGGRSTRMGHDKGLIRSGKMTWAEQQVSKLKILGLPVFISINESQVAAYLEIFQPTQLIVDRPFSNINGPLQGLLSAHHAFPEKHIVCIPCDMPNLSETFLTKLLNIFTRYYPEYQLFIPKAAEQIQPLCGLYAKECLDYFTEQYEAGYLKNKSMIHLVKTHPGVKMILFDDAEEEFGNYNTPKDLS